MQATIGPVGLVGDAVARLYAGTQPCKGRSRDFGANRRAACPPHRCAAPIYPRVRRCGRWRALRVADPFLLAVFLPLLRSGLQGAFQPGECGFQTRRCGGNVHPATVLSPWISWATTSTAHCGVRRYHPAGNRPAPSAPSTIGCIFSAGTARRSMAGIAPHPNNAALKCTDGIAAASLLLGQDPRPDNGRQYGEATRSGAAGQDLAFTSGA